MESNTLTRLKRVAGKQTTTLTHYGRKTGKPHEVTIWYHLRNTGFTAESALLELSTIYKVYLRDAQHRFRLSRVVTLTKNQELVLKAVDKSLLKS
jgi:hypothetical protein